MIENEDYELVPSELYGDQTWDIRILKGEYTETMIRFGNVSIEEDGMLHFNFDVVVSPRGARPTEEPLQKLAGQILMSVIENSIENEEILIKDRESGENIMKPVDTIDITD